MDQSRPASAAERALLERLQERRQELDARARALDLRESMLKAAEKKLETQVSAEKTEVAKGVAGASPAQRKDEAENARFKSVVTMYETMKPKDAAKIFDRLDIRVLLEVASAIKPHDHVRDPGADVDRGGRTPDGRACGARAGRSRHQPGEPAEDRRPPERHVGSCRSI